MQKNNCTVFWVFGLPLFMMIFAQNAFADISIAHISSNLMEPVHLFTEAVYNICYIVAIMLFFASLAQYRAYRLSPNQTPLNRPIVLFLLALSVALIPFIAKLSEAAKYTVGN